MSKRDRERVRRYKNPNLPQEAFNNPIAKAATATSAAGADASAMTGPRKINWQGEYGEVLGDLRRTAIIAVGMIAVMVVLSFVIR